MVCLLAKVDRERDREKDKVISAEEFLLRRQAYK